LSASHQGVLPRRDDHLVIAMNNCGSFSGSHTQLARRINGPVRRVPPPWPVVLAWDEVVVQVSFSVAGQ
jgi:hypothetical protein